MLIYKKNESNYSNYFICLFYFLFLYSCKAFWICLCIKLTLKCIIVQRHLVCRKTLAKSCVLRILWWKYIVHECKILRIDTHTTHIQTLKLQIKLKIKILLPSWIKFKTHIWDPRLKTHSTWSTSFHTDAVPLISPQTLFLLLWDAAPLCRQWRRLLST